MKRGSSLPSCASTQKGASSYSQVAVASGPPSGMPTRREVAADQQVEELWFHAEGHSLSPIYPFRRVGHPPEWSSTRLRRIFVNGICGPDHMPCVKNYQTVLSVAHLGVLNAWQSRPTRRLGAGDDSIAIKSKDNSSPPRSTHVPAPARNHADQGESLCSGERR